MIFPLKDPLSRRLSIAQEWDDLIPIDSVWSNPYLCGWLKLLSTYVQIVVHCFVTQNPAGVDLPTFNPSRKSDPACFLGFGQVQKWGIFKIPWLKTKLYSPHGSSSQKSAFVWTSLFLILFFYVLLSPIIYL